LNGEDGKGLGDKGFTLRNGGIKEVRSVWREGVLDLSYLGGGWGGGGEWEVWGSIH